MKAVNHGIQTKAWNYLFEVIGLRGMVEPELSHPKWNGFKKALKTADLEYSALRLTICSNFNHGAFKSGDKLHSKMESLQQYLSHQPEEYFEEQAELICFDRNEPVEPSAAKLALEDWMEAPSIKNRLKFVAAFNAGNDDGDGNGDDDEGQQEDEDTMAPAPRLSKSELYQAYSGRGPVQMFSDFMADRTLQLDAIIISRVAEPLEEEYEADLKAQRSGAAGLAEWAATRSSGTLRWWRTARNILKMSQNRNLFARLGLSPSSSSPLGFDNGASWLEEEKAVLGKVHSFSIALASNVVWSEVMFWMNLPHAAAVLLHPDRQKRETEMKCLKELILAVEKAERLAPQDPALRECLEDLAWNVQPLPREIMAHCFQSGFDANNEQLRMIMWKLYAGSNTTKECLESTFAHLSDIAQRAAKCTKMADWTKYLYATASPYAETGGMTQIKPEPEDWLATLSAGNVTFRNGLQSIFNMTTTAMPTVHGDVQLPMQPGQIRRKKWRSSGPTSHQRSSAAAMFLVQDMPRDFADAGMAWAGRHFYYHTSANKYFKSLGFRKWAALGAAASASKVGDEHRPAMLTNYSVAEDNHWRFIDVDILPPACVPQELASYGSVFRVRVPGGAMLLPASVNAGIFLTVKQLKHIIGALDIKLPKKGSGTNNKFIKSDFAKALVGHLFPEATPADNTRMVDIICNRNAKTSKNAWESEVLETVSKLDPENADASCFKNMAKVALHKMEEDIVARETEFRSPRESSVPRTLIGSTEKRITSGISALRNTGSSTEKGIASGISALRNPGNSTEKGFASVDGGNAMGGIRRDDGIAVAADATSAPRSQIGCSADAADATDATSAPRSQIGNNATDATSAPRSQIGSKASIAGKPEQNASAAPPSSPARAAPSPAKVILVKVKEEPLGSPLRGVVSSSKLAAGTTPGVVLRKRRNSSPRPILAIHEDDLGLSAKSQRTLLSALNTGSYEELVALDGIGGTSAERIIKYRSGKGQGFCHVADLKKVLAAQLVSRIVNHYR
ncbi:unnamed protein product [Polarella glacialis]|uniref:Uncharacterized protein n=1 Tax=Polarella glacialis TaxID=89957 RepID=A0A813GS67_POLGL|nr:unnamed protein product [Polarella glacialis]